LLLLLLVAVVVLLLVPQTHLADPWVCCLRG
jgi:hypothetical protein